jgi:hypothetical protein
MKTVEIDLAGPAQVDRVFVAALASLGGTTLFLIEIDGDTVVVALETLARPEGVLAVAMVTWRIDSPGKLVAIPDPEVGGLTESGLDTTGVEDLLQQDALSVVRGVAREVEVVLVDDGVRRLHDVEGVEGDAAFLAEVVEVLGALRKRLRKGELSNIVNTDIRMSGPIGRDVLVHLGSGGSHDEGMGDNEWYK